MAAKDQVRCPQCGVPNDPDALFCSRCGASQNRPGHAGTVRRRVSLAGVTMALACLIALGITVFVLYTIITHALAPAAEANTSSSIYTGVPGTVATLATATTVRPTTTTNVARGSILVRPSAATSSSALTPTNLTDFRATNVLDGDVVTAWVEGAKGTGAGEWVKLEFDEPITLARIEISNGYQKDDDFFANYVRVKSLQIAYSDGTKQVVQLQDEQGLQVIQTPTSDGQALKTGSIEFTILSVYPAYKFPQAAISDIKVYEVLQ